MKSENPPTNHERQNHLPLSTASNEQPRQMLTPQPQHPQHQRLIIPQYEENSAGFNTQVENQPSYSQLSHPRKTFTDRLTSLLKTLLLPVLLMGLGYVVLAIFGKKGLAPLNEWLNNIWLPATFIRVTVYVVLIFLATPYLFRQVQQQKLSNLQFIKQEYIQDNGQIDLRQLGAIESEIQNIQRTRPPFLGMALILGLIELLFIQLPFILK